VRRQAVKHADRTLANNAQPRGTDHVGMTVPDPEAATRFLVEAPGAAVHRTETEVSGN
jgi:hypothetical protein